MRMEIGAHRAVERIANRLLMLLARGVLRLVDDARAIQEVQVTTLHGEVRGKLEHFQHYGFTSHPLPGAEAAVLFVGGDRAHGLVIAIDDRRYRLHPLEAGEVALYTDEGDKIVLKRDRKIEVTSGSQVTISGATLVRVTSATKIELAAPTIAISADTAITLDAPSVIIQGKPDFKVHHHSGVTTGGGQTGNVV